MILTLLATSTVLILGIFCLRKLTFGRISMRVRYALWIPVALRLLFPFSVGESSISVMNVLPAGWSDMRQLQTGLIERDTNQVDVYADDGEGIVDFDKQNSGGEDAVGGDGQNVPGQRFETNHFAAGQVSGMADSASGQRTGTGGGVSKLRLGFMAEYPYVWHMILGGVWIVGFAAAGGYMLLSRQRFMRYLKKNRSLLSEDVIADDFAERFSVRGMEVYQVPGLPSPCLVGRDIYIGSGVLDDRKNLPHILAHEYCHALHKDGWWAFLRSFLVAVYWFDPLVWAAAYAARQDSELACDEAAVKLLGESERFAYGRTLLNLLENGDDNKGCPGMSYMLNRGEKGVRERIGALADSGGKKGAAAVLVLLAALTLCGCAFTGAAKDGADAVADEAENPMENGRYLLCENKDAGISLYGLYTEEFGFRGLKTLIGEDVNTFDERWCASQLNSGDNIRVLEQVEDGLPLLTIQIAEDEKSESGFRLGHPRIDETYTAHAPWQEKELTELRDETLSAQTGDAFKADQNDLDQPIINDEVEGHHDLAIDFINPCPDFERISAGYGGRTHPVTGEARTHVGVDMVAAEGADILAAADGEVFMTGFDTVNGNYVVLWHGQSGQMTYYAHCKTVEVAKGQQVAQGERIATVGQTGQATGPFLHFAISSENNWQEPYFLEIN